MESDNELEFGMANLILDDEEDKNKNSDSICFEEEFLKPTKLEYNEELQAAFLPKKKEESPEIKYIKFQRKEPKEEYLFTPTKLLFDNEFDDSKENEEEFLFKPTELIYKDPLEIFNQRREQTSNVNPLKPLNYKDEPKKEIIKEEIKEEVKEEPKIEEIKEEIKEEKIEELKIEETKEEQKEEIKIKNEENKEQKNKQIDIIPQKGIKTDEKIEEKNDEKNATSSKHFIAAVKESIEKNTTKSGEKPEQEKKYRRFRVNQNKEESAKKEPKKELFMRKDFEEVRNDEPNVGVYRSKYSRVTKKDKNEENIKEKNDNRKEKEKEKEKIEEPPPTKYGYKRIYFKTKNEPKEKEKPVEKKEKNETFSNINATTETPSYGGYGRRRFKKEELEKEKKEEIVTEKVETIPTTSKYGGRYLRAKTNIEEPKKVEKETEKEPVKAEPIAKYSRYKKTITNAEPEKEEKPKEEPPKFVRRRFYNNNTSENLENVVPKLKEKEEGTKKDEIGFKRSYYGKFRKLRYEQEEVVEKKEEKPAEMSYTRGYYKKSYAKVDDFKKDDNNKNKEKAEPIFGRFGKKRFGQSNNDNNTIKGEKNEKENIENKPGRFQYKGRYGKNNTNDEKDNSDKIENVVVKREVVRSKYNPQTERVTTTTTTTTVTSGNGPTYFSRRRLKQKETKEEEPKEESKPVNTETVVKRRFKYMQGK